MYAVYCFVQKSPIKTKSPARRLNFNIPAATESRIPNGEIHLPPTVTKHFKRHDNMSSLAERRYTAPPKQAGLQLKSVLGYNGNGRKNMIWKYDTGTYSYCSGVSKHSLQLQSEGRGYSQVNTMDSLSNLELIYSSGTISLHDRLEKLWLYMPSS